jgi:ParB-like chromosome segregation protein Spo0J
MNIIKSVTPMPAPTYDYIAHPLANMFPMIEGQEFENLKASIAKSGILEPIRLFQGLILDGRNRYTAGKACGHQFTAKDFKEWIGTVEEAEAWVLETNLHRRHLTAKQKQEMVRARIKKCPSMSNRQIAKQLGVSHTMVADERERITNPPELRKFEDFKRTWEGLSDDHRKAFVKEFNIDLSDLQKSMVEHSTIANPRTSVMA